MIDRKFQEKVAIIRARHANKGAATSSASKQDTTGNGGARLDKEKVLKVSWEKVGGDYTAGRLRELFSKFGEVEGVAIKSLKKRGSALVAMANKEAVAATRTVFGDLSNRY